MYMQTENKSQSLSIMCGLYVSLTRQYSLGETPTCLSMCSNIDIYVYWFVRKCVSLACEDSCSFVEWFLTQVWILTKDGAFSILYYPYPHSICSLNNQTWSSIETTHSIPYFRYFKFSSSSLRKILFHLLSVFPLFFFSHFFSYYFPVTLTHIITKHSSIFTY